jgi:uncharacterized protein YkwD
VKNPWSIDFKGALGKFMQYTSKLLLALVIILAGCIQQPQAAVVSPYTSGPVEVTISAVEILRVAAEPSDVRVVINGTLPDRCVLLKEPSLERDGRLFSITLLANRVESGECESAPITFERVVPLALNSGSGPVDGRFGVLVNGVQQFFEVKVNAIVNPGGQPSPVVGSVSITSTPEATASPSAAAIEAPAATEAPVATAVPELVITMPPAEVTPAAQTITLGPASGPDNCTNKAAVYDDIPLPAGNSLDAGTKFKKTWRVRNEGTCAWGSGYQLVLVHGDALGLDKTLPLPPAASGEVVEVSLQMTAPELPGLYSSDWGFSTSDGQAFGLGGAGLVPLKIKVGVRQPPILNAGCDYQFDAEQELKILELINAERALLGLPPHSLDEGLSNVARAHSLERGCLGAHSHSGADGKNYETRVKRAKIAYRFVSEIIYTGNYGAKWAVQWWVYKSKLHHDIVMSTKFSTVGIGYVKTNRGEYGDYFTVLFILPP